MRPSSLEALSEPDPRRDPAVHTQSQAVAPALDGAEPQPVRSLVEDPGAEAPHDPPLPAVPLDAAGEPAGGGAAQRQLPPAAPADDPDLREPRRTRRNGAGWRSGCHYM